jgi:tRNA(His) 5'-end guanylyltransferase
MKFDELDKRMRIYETAHDHCVLPGVHIVARLDGRNFTRLTKDEQSFDAPFDARFRDLMLETVQHLMQVGFKVLYGYTESDEISLLFALEEDGFGRKTRKINSVLAGEASARFSLSLGALACFDCRVSQLPTEQNVIDYFRWRHEDAHRNALNAHCYWRLRSEGARRRAGDPATLRHVDRRQERAAVPARHQLQRTPPLAEARHRRALGELRERGAEPKDRRAHRGRAPPPAHRARAAHGRRV